MRLGGYPPESNARRSDGAGGDRHLDECATEEALKLQTPLSDNSLKIVARGDKKDEGGLAA